MKKKQDVLAGYVLLASCMFGFLLGSLYGMFVWS